MLDDEEFLKELALKAADQLKNAPEYMQNFNLLRLCKSDETGKFEKMARTLAAHHVPSEEIIPCLMELFIELC